MAGSAKLPDQDTFAQKSSSFLTWFSSQNDSRLSSKIQLGDLRTSNEGRGVVAVDNIAEDEELFAIPRSLVLSPPNASLPPQILDDLGTFTGWLPLILAIIYEYLRKDKSPWAPYLDVLPNTFDTLMFWSRAELEELQASAVLKKIGKQDAESSWNNTIIPLMLKNPTLFPVSGIDEDSRRAELARLAHIAGSLIMAYAFDIDSNSAEYGSPKSSDDDSFIDDDEDDPAKGMIPLADMLNADGDRNNVGSLSLRQAPEANTSIKARLFQEDEFLIMRSIKPIRAGEEIFNDYGPLPRSELLRMYGYITDNYEKYDVVELPRELFISSARSQVGPKNLKPFEKLLDSIEDQDIFEDGYTLPRPGEVDHLEIVIPAEIRTVLKTLSRATRQPPAGLQSNAFTLEQAELMAIVLQQRLSQYATSESEDRVILEALRKNSDTQKASVPEGVSRIRYQMAVRVRKAEKEICVAVLRKCLAFVEEVKGKSTNNIYKRKDSEVGRPNKRMIGVAHEKRIKR